MKNIVKFVLIFGLLGLAFANPMPQEAIEEDQTPMPMPVSIRFYRSGFLKEDQNHSLNSHPKD